MKQMERRINTYNARLAALLYIAAFLLIVFATIYHLRTTGYVNQESVEDKFDSLEIKARSVYVFDTETNKQIYGINENVPLPLASITKIMTALCALDNLEHKRIITIASSTLEIYGDRELKVGDRWQVDDLASYMLVKSSNDAALTLSQAMGGSSVMLSCMNRSAEELGLFETKFYNETGLDIDTGPGAYGSAEDAASMLEYATRAYPEIFGRTRYQSYNIDVQNGSIQVATNTNRAQNQIVGMEASKTGLTDLAGGNLVFEMNVGLSHRVVVAILGSTEEGRFEDALQISQAVINKYDIGHY